VHFEIGKTFATFHIRSRFFLVGQLAYRQGRAFGKFGSPRISSLLESRSDLLVWTTLLKHVGRRDEVVHRYLAKRHLKSKLRHLKAKLLHDSASVHTSWLASFLSALKKGVGFYSSVISGDWGLRPFEVSSGL
jgi:hypothetical protein